MNNTDEQMRLERERRRKKRQKRRLRARIRRMEVLLLATLFIVLACFLIREHKSAQEQTIEAGRTAASHEDDAKTMPGEKEENEAGASDEQEPDQNPDLADTADLNESLQDEQKAEEAERTEEELRTEETAAEPGDRKLADDDSGEIVLTFAGDVCFHDAYSNMQAYVQRGSDIANCISEKLLTQMRDSDVCMVNNEFTYTTRGEPTAGKTYAFRSKPENVGILKDMGVDIVSLANNHSYDYGEVSLLDTLDTLERAGIPYVGAGRDKKEASGAVTFCKNGIRVTYLSATQIERLDDPDTKGATENSPGTFRCWGKALEDLTDAVRRAKEKEGVVIVYIHWGTENVAQPDWAQLEQAKALAQAGADLIMGDHSHCLQPFANVDGVPVIYSLGNYWFNSKTLDTGLVKVVLSREGLKSYQFIPAVQHNCKTTIADGAEKERILEYMRSISPGISIDADGFVDF